MLVLLVLLFKVSRLVLDFVYSISIVCCAVRIWASVICVSAETSEMYCSKIRWCFSSLVFSFWTWVAKNPPYRCCRACKASSTPRVSPINARDDTRFSCCVFVAKMPSRAFWWASCEMYWTTSSKPLAWREVVRLMPIVWSWKLALFRDSISFLGPSEATDM